MPLLPFMTLVIYNIYNISVLVKPTPATSGEMPCATEAFLI